MNKSDSSLFILGMDIKLSSSGGGPYLKGQLVRLKTHECGTPKGSFWKNMLNQRGIARHDGNGIGRNEVDIAEIEAEAEVVKITENQENTKKIKVKK